MSSRARSKEGQAITEFWIVKTPFRRMNWLPKLFWTEEGMRAHVEYLSGWDKTQRIEVFHIDLKAMQVKQIL